MSGGKGGSTSSSVTVPQYIEDAARRNLDRADKISKTGFIPYYGADVAAFTPMQEAAFQNTADTANVFGTAGGNMSQQDIRGGMPEPTTFAGGVRGYSSAPMYEQSLEALAAARPGQKEYIDSFFIDPYTGRAGSNAQSMVDYAPVSGDLGGINRGETGGGGETYFPPVVTPPVVTPPVVTPTPIDVPFTIPPVVDGPYIDDLSDGFDDSLSQNTPVLTTDELTTRLEEEERLKQEDARRRADELAALAASNDLNIFDQNQLDGNSSFYTGSNFPGFSAEETNAAAFDPRGFNPTQSTGGLVTGGGADGVGNLGQVGDFFGGLLGGLNLTGPVTPKSASELQYEADRAPGGVSYESSGSQRNEAAAFKAGQEKTDQMAQVIDIAAVKDLTKSKDKAQEWLKDNGYGSVDRDNASDTLRVKIADIEKSQLKQGLTDGVVMENDRRQVWVGGEMVANVKSASDAKERLATAVANKPSPTTGFTQAQTDLAQALFAQGVPAAEVRAQVLNGGKTGNFNFVPFA